MKQYKYLKYYFELLFLKWWEYVRIIGESVNVKKNTTRAAPLEQHTPISYPKERDFPEDFCPGTECGRRGGARGWRRRAGGGPPRICGGVAVGSVPLVPR